MNVAKMLTPPKNEEVNGKPVQKTVWDAMTYGSTNGWASPANLNAIGMMIPGASKITGFVAGKASPIEPEWSYAQRQTTAAANNNVTTQSTPGWQITRDAFGNITGYKDPFGNIIPPNDIAMSLGLQGGSLNTPANIVPGNQVGADMLSGGNFVGATSGGTPEPNWILILIIALVVIFVLALILRRR